MQRDVRNIITAAAAVNAITFSTKVTLGGRTTFACRVHRSFQLSLSLSPHIIFLHPEVSRSDQGHKTLRKARRGPKYVVGTLLLIALHCMIPTNCR